MHMNYSGNDVHHFNYVGERFADLQLLRYRLNGFEQLSLLQKQLVYYLSKATLYGRDITFDQFGRYNLRIRKTLEAIYTDLRIDHHTEDFLAMEVYLKRVWFSNGIYHHYACDKFVPNFSDAWLRKAIQQVDAIRLPLHSGETVEQLCDELIPVIFDPEVLPKRVNKADGEDLVKTSACNFYEGVSQEEAEDFYQRQKEEAGNDPAPISYGLNTTLVKRDGLIKYYQTGDLRVFNDYCIEWVGEHEGRIDFVNGFIEVYGDPLGLKASWEGIVEYKDLEATKRTQTISSNAQWFEDHSPVDPRFRKPHVKGVTANAICAAMLGGDEYPSTAIGINLPNADWIRSQHGSKSITISNITDAYNKAARGNGFKEEFVIDDETRSLIVKYGDLCDDLHTDLHECLGHGSGQLLPGTDPDALRY